MVKFISYSGEWPNLCRGELILCIEGKEVNLGCCLCSGGNVWFDDQLQGCVDTGAWSVDVPEEFARYEDEIIAVVNENVPYGCCGGCL